MTDITRALLLPDVSDPSLEVLRNLAVYWDELVCPNYGKSRYFAADDPLVAEGVVSELSRHIPPEKIFPIRGEIGEHWAYSVGADESGHPTRVELVPWEPPEGPKRKGAALQDYTEESLEAFAGISLSEHLGYVDDSLAISASNNLAPVSHSVGGHFAAVIGSSEAGQPDVPVREAALLSVVVEAFAIDPSTSSEEVLALRVSGGRAQARLRASLVDLAAGLRSDAPPATMLAEARDTYRNRVEPALGDLEEVLKENQVKFLMKSVVGATAIALAPIDPISASAGAARVMGQTIDYSYSKSRLVREHPYGYLHQVREALGVEASQPGKLSMETAMKIPRQSLWELWYEHWKKKRELARSVGSE